MTGGQIVALICAILLLLPGGCFLYVAVSGYPFPVMLIIATIAAVFLSLAGLLFWLALRRRPPDQGGSPDAPPV